MYMDSTSLIEQNIEVKENTYGDQLQVYQEIVSPNFVYHLWEQRMLHNLHSGQEII